MEGLEGGSGGNGREAVMKRPAAVSGSSAAAEKARGPDAQPLSFDAAPVVRDYLYFADSGPAQSLFAVDARQSAVLSSKPRILEFAIVAPGKGGTPRLTVAYRGDAPRVLEERLPLWTLPQMREVLRALRARTTRRAVGPPLTAEAVALRCPALWWSLVAFMLGWRPEGGRPVDLGLEFPLSVRADMRRVVGALADAAAEGVSERAALQIMEEVAQT